MTAYALINLTWQWGGDYALLRREAKGADVIVFVEGRRGNDAPVNVAEALPDFDVIQDVTDGGDKAGSGIAVRRDSHVRIRRWNMRIASRAGRDVQDRWRVTAVLIDSSSRLGRRRVKLAVQHNPVAHNARQPQAVRSARRWVSLADTWAAVTGCRWALFGDFNMTPQEMQNRTGAFRSWGSKPMGILLSRGWRVTFDSHRSEGADHPVLTMKER